MQIKEIIKLIRKTITEHPKLYAFLFIFLTSFIINFISHNVFVSDETGYISNARSFLNGYNFSTLSFVYPGFSLLLMPVFLFTDNIQLAYVYTHFINAIMLGVLSTLIYQFLESKTYYSKWRLFLLSITISFYPSFTCFAGFALPEILFIFLFFLLVIQIDKISNMDKLNIRWLYSFFIMLALLTTHPRAIVIVIAYLITMFLIILKLFKKIPAQQRNTILISFFIVSFGIIAGLFYLVQNSGRYSQDLGSILTSYLNFKFIINQLVAVFGKLYYFLMSSYGVFSIGFYFSFKTIIDQRKKILSEKNNSLIYLIFTLLSFFFIMFITTRSENPNALGRADLIIYGRYLEGVFLPILIFGFICLFDKKLKVIDIIKILILNILCILITIMIRGYQLEKLIVNPENIFGIYIYRFFTKSKAINNGVVIIYSALVAIIFYLLKKIKINQAIAFLLLVFILNIIFIYHDYFYKNELVTKERLNLVEVLNEIKSYPSSLPFIVSYDVVGSIEWYYYAYQGYIPQMGMIRYSSIDPTTKPAADIIISGRSDLDKVYQGIRMAGKVNKNNQFLWLLPGERLNEASKSGMLLSEKFFNGDYKLPEEAYKAEIVVVSKRNSFKRHEEFILPVKVTHLGTGSFWPMFTNQEKLGAVKLSPFVVDQNKKVFNLPRADLSTSLYPGKSAIVPLSLDLSLQNSNLAVGKYLLVIDLVQEPDILFSHKGNKPLQIEMEITDSRVKLKL